MTYPPRAFYNGLMARLRIYTVHINPALERPYEAARFVREGFSWRAFLFTGLWLIYHRMWLAAAVTGSATALLFYKFEDGAFALPGYAILTLGLHLIIGFHATDWLRSKLRRKGYVMTDITTGDSDLRAEQRFFDRYFAKPAALAAH